MAMLAFLAGDDWETSPAQQAGYTSPVTAGADLSTALPVCQPPALFPEHMVGQQEPLFLNIVLPTHVDHDGAVVAAASVRVRALGGVLSESEMRAVLKVAGWPPSEIPNALRVSFCESRWSAYATNGVDNGLFGMSSAQNATLRGGWLTYWGFSEEQTFDPVTNATAALWTWQRSGWTPWSCRIAVY